MQIPSPDTASDRLELLGLAHLAALARNPALADLVIVFQPAQDLLGAAASARLAAERGMVGPRVDLRFVERAAEGALRRLASAAEAIDGKRGGALFTELFPDGTAAETKPRAASQRAALERVLVRLKTKSTVAALRAEHQPALEAAHAALDTALKARQAAATTFANAYAVEIAAREDWVRACDANAGAIRQRFPKDREQQDLYFDRIRTVTRRDDDEEPTDPSAG